jgi:fido (protein-threonine AMPylation protein)
MRIFRVLRLKHSLSYRSLSSCATDIDEAFGAAPIFAPPGKEQNREDHAILNRENHVLNLVCERVHPFREGNGRAKRKFIRELRLNAGLRVDWTRVTRIRSALSLGCRISTGRLSTDGGPDRKDRDFG